MSKKWITFLVAAVVGSLLLPSAAFAVCQVNLVTALSYVDLTAAANNGADPQPFVAGDKIGQLTLTAAPAGGLNVNQEGVSERVVDLVISDTGVAPNCFATGNSLVVTYNAILTSPTTPGSLGVPANLDIFDSNGIGGLTVASANVTQGFAANTTQSLITIVVGQAGTVGNLTTGSVGSAVRVKNIRVNASLLAAASTVSVTFSGGSYAGANPVGVVATLGPTMTGVVPPGIPATGGPADGTQSSGVGLNHIQTIGFTEGFADSLRTPGGTCASRTVASDTCYSQVANDISTNATSLVFALTNIPSGVTVTFPATMTTSGIAGATVANSMVFTARAGSLTNSGAPGALTVIYDTSKAGTTANVLTVETADNADPGTTITITSGATPNPNCKVVGGVAVSNNHFTNGGAAGAPCDANPKVGVVVGGTSQAGTSSLNWAFGPGDVGTSLFTGDDTAASTSVIPRYTGTARNIIASAANHKFFVITPVVTNLLFPFVSTVGNFNTGLSVANTCADTGVYNGVTTPTCSQAGGVTFYFFGVLPSTKAPITTSINTDLTAGGVSVTSACRGFDSNGRVQPGIVVACSLSALLPLLPGAPTGFDGYVIAVASFNNGHGFSAQFNGSGSPFAANPALVLAGTGRPAPEGGLGN